MAYNRRYAARKIQRVFRKYRMRKMMGFAARKGAMIRRSVGLGNPTPTFVETYAASSFTVNTGAGIGQTFGVRISDIPQLAQYANLYKQYRINWVKVIVIPDFNTQASDHNAAAYNGSVAVPTFGQIRVVHAIQDSPNITVPASEAVVLQDNGSKIKALGSKWSVSFKPVPDVQQTTAVGTIWTRQKYRQWFNFDLVTTGNNPFHGAVAAYFTNPASIAASASTLNVYYKVSFTLRDPQ